MPRAVPLLVAPLLLCQVALGARPPVPRAAPAVGDRDKPYDTSSLVQLAVVPKAGHDRGAPPNTSRQAEVQGYRFPLTHEELYHFVASAAFMLRWVDRRIHYYDVAFYLDSSSPLWGGTRQPNCTEDQADLLLGKVQFIILLQSRMASRKSMAALVDALRLFAKSRALRNATLALDALKRCYRRGPRMSSGSLITLEPNRTGLQVVLNGARLCFVESDFLGSLVLDQYLGNRSDFPQLRDAAFTQLAVGMPDQVSSPVVVNVETRLPWWVTTVLVMIGVLACAGVLVLYHNCSRRRRDERPDAA